MNYELPAELTIWNNMTPQQRGEVMKKVPYNRSTTKWYRACIKYVRENISEFQKVTA